MLGALYEQVRFHITTKTFHPHISVSRLTIWTTMTKAKWSIKYHRRLRWSHTCPNCEQICGAPAEQWDICSRAHRDKKEQLTMQCRQNQALFGGKTDVHVAMRFLQDGPRKIRWHGEQEFLKFLEVVRVPLEPSDGQVETYGSQKRPKFQLLYEFRS